MGNWKKEIRQAVQEGRLNKYPIVFLKWIDVQMLDTALIYPEELTEKPIMAGLVGFLIKETKDNYFIAKEVWETGQCKWVHIIPKKYVIKKENLGWKK